MDGTTPTNLRQLRHAAGLSIRQMELRTGINRGRLSYLERGIEPTDSERARFLEALREQPIVEAVKVRT